MIPNTPSRYDDDPDEPEDEDAVVRRVIPPDVLERGLIGICLVSDHMPGEVPFLRPEHFFSTTARAAWQGLIDMDAMGCIGDIPTLAEHLDRTAHVSDVNWETWLARSIGMEYPILPFNFEHDARTLLDYAQRRQHIRDLQQQIHELADLTVPLADSGLVSMKGVVHTLAEAYEPIPLTNWLVEKIIAPGMVVLVYGQPATKKTYSMFWLGACSANEKDWLGFKTRKASVLYVDQESAEPRIRRRVRECQNGVGGDQTAPIVWVTMQGYKLSNKADIAKIQQIKREHHVELIIIDSLSKHTAGDENSAADMAKEMDGLRELSTNPDAAVIAIHHSLKSASDEFRGSSSIEASVDMMICVESEEGSAYVNYTMKKNRDGELIKWTARAHWVRLEGEPEKDQFYMERVEGRKEEADSSEEEASKTGARDYVIRYLREHGESELQAIMSAAQGCSGDSAKNAVYALVRLAKVQKVSSGRYTLVTEATLERNKLNQGSNSNSNSTP